MMGLEDLVNEIKPRVEMQWFPKFAYITVTLTWNEIESDAHSWAGIPHDQVETTIEKLTASARETMVHKLRSIYYELRDAQREALSEGES